MRTLPMLRRCVLLHLALLASCGGSEVALVPDPATATLEAGGDSALALEVSASKQAGSLPAPIDLLHGVPTTVVVSSVYGGSAAQAARLVDGDLETAWNSRTGDLVGAWIEVRLPEGVRVSGLRMTVGFTRRRDDRDLFAGNFRITRVRVTHAGSEPVEQALDPGVRTLQTIALEGGGGTYRIEVLAAEPGERADWREICVSELQVMGRAPDAAAGTHTPRVEASPDAGTERAAEEPAAAGTGAAYFAVDSCCIVRYSSGRATRVSDLEDVYDFDVSDAGVVYALNGAIHEYRGRRSRTLPRPPGRAAIAAIAVDGADGLFAISRQALFHWRGGRWSTIAVEAATGSEDFIDVAVDPQGDVWVLDRLGGVYGGSGERLARVEHPRAGRARFVQLAAGGAGVVSAIQGQLVTFHAPEWRTLAQPFGIADAGSLAVGADGTTIVGTEHRPVLLVLTSQGEARRVDLHALHIPEGDRVHAVARDSSSYTWLATGAGIVVLAPDYSVARVITADTVVDLGAVANQIVVRGRGPFF